MSMAAEQLITQHLDLWTVAIKRRSTAGRGSSSKIELYGIKKLRELILELAVRGLLVPQDSKDEPASELLKKIAAEKARLVKGGKIKKDKPLPSITVDEKSFELPAGWQWAKLGMLMEMFNGRAFSQTEWSSEGLPIIRIQNLNDKNAPFNYFNGDVSETNYVEPGTFLISWSGTPGTSFGAFIWNGPPGALNQHINKCMIFGDEINKQYLRLAVNSCMDHLIENAQGGVGLKHVTKGTLNNCVFAIPPLAEQHRIVAKVDELMALCDQLEQQIDTSLSAHQTLVDTLLNALISAASHAQFASSWQRIAEHFDTLFTSEESIDQLKQAILQLAVMGKLVPQDPKDEPASELLKKIAAEKAKLVRDGKIRAAKPLPVIADEEKPFQLPKTWAFVRWGQIADWAIGSGFPNAAQGETGQEIFFAKVSDMNLNGNEKYIVNTVNSVSRDTLIKIKAKAHPRGTVVFPKIGGAIATNKRRILTRDTAIDNNCLGLIPGSGLTTDYLYLLLSSVDLSKFQSGTSIPALSQGSLELIVAGLPPRAEQDRIVAKVDELLLLCESLRKQLVNAQSIRVAMADALSIVGANP